MTERRDVLAELRRANPVPDADLVNAVPYVVDPLWQTIVGRSETMNERRHVIDPSLEEHPRSGATREVAESGMVDDDQGDRVSRGRRWRLVAGLGVAAAVVAVIFGAGLLRSNPESDPGPVGPDQGSVDEILADGAEMTPGIAVVQEMFEHVNAGRIDETMELIGLDARVFGTEPANGQPAIGRETLRRWAAFELALDGQWTLRDCGSRVPDQGDQERVLCKVVQSGLLDDHATGEPSTQHWAFSVDPATGTVSELDGLPPHLTHLRSFRVWARADEPARYEAECNDVRWQGDVAQIAEFDPVACAAFVREFADDWAATTG